MKKTENQKKFRTNYSEPLIKAYDSGPPGKTQQQFLNQNNPHAVVQRHTTTSRIPTYVNTYDYTPETVHQTIQELKNEVDIKNKEMEKKKNEQNEKTENDLKEKIRKEINDQRKDIPGSNKTTKTNDQT